MNPLITADDTLLLWAFLMLAALAAIYVEQNFRWAAKIPGAVFALLIALCASNLGIIPTDAPVYDAVWSYVVPLAIPLLLFQFDLRAVFKESRRLLLLFAISSFGTVLGAILGFILLSKWIPELAKIAGMISASYTGGGVNFAAMVARLEPSKDLTAATIVADNLTMACYFLILIGMVAIPQVRRIWGSPHYTQAAENPTDKNPAAAYWQAKPISLQNIAFSLGLAIFLVAVSFTVSVQLKAILGTSSVLMIQLLISLVTDKYLLLTTLTFLIIALFPRKMSALNGSQELGTYCIYLFFVVIGVPASIPLVVYNTPLLFVFALLVALTNLMITLLFGKLLKFNIEEIVLASNANIGGPTTAAALAIGQGWRDLVAPILVVGIMGYILGNYIGSLVYSVLVHFFN